MTTAGHLKLRFHFRSVKVHFIERLKLRVSLQVNCEVCPMRVDRRSRTCFLECLSKLSSEGRWANVVSSQLLGWAEWRCQSWGKLFYAFWRFSADVGLLPKTMKPWRPSQSSRYSQERQVWDQLLELWCNDQASYFGKGKTHISPKPTVNNQQLYRSCSVEVSSRDLVFEKVNIFTLGLPHRDKPLT